MLAVLTWCVLLLVPATVEGQRTSIVVGGAADTQGALAAEGENLRFGFGAWAQWVNERGGIQLGPGGPRYNVTIITKDASGETTQEWTLAINRTYTELVMEDNVDILFGPFSSSRTLVASTVANQFNVTMCAPTAAAPSVYNRGYRYLYTPLPVSTEWVKPPIDALLGKGARRFAIISKNDSLPLSTAAGARGYLLSLAQSGSIKGAPIDIVIYETYSAVLGNVGFDEVNKLLASVAAMSPPIDALLLAAQPDDFSTLSVILEANAVPVKALLFMGQIPTISSLTPDDRRRVQYVMNNPLWLPTMRYGRSGRYLGTAAEFAEYFAARYGRDAGITEANAAACGVLLQIALERAGTLDPERLRAYLFSVNDEVFYGPLGLDPNGYNAAKPMIVAQVIGDRLLGVQPDAARAGDVNVLSDIVYPAKFAWIRDNDNSSDQSSDYTTVVIVTVVLGTLFIAAVAVAVAGFAYFRRKQAAKRLVKPDFARDVIFTGEITAPIGRLNTADRAALVELQQLLRYSEFLSAVRAVTKVTADGFSRIARGLVIVTAVDGSTVDILTRWIREELTGTGLLAESGGGSVGVSTSRQDTVFREDTLVTTMYTYFAHMIGAEYLWDTLALILDELHDRRYRSTETDKGSDSHIELTTSFHLSVRNFEIDPNRLTEADNEVLNRLSLLVFTQQILVALMSSAPRFPKPLRAILRTMATLPPHIRYRTIGNFLFLRYLCPAISRPKYYGLFKKPPTPSEQRLLVLMSKILQTLANDTIFEKEGFMTKLNDFIRDNLEPLHRFEDKLVGIGEDTHPTAVRDKNNTGTDVESANNDDSEFGEGDFSVSVPSVAKYNALCALFSHVRIYKDAIMANLQSEEIRDRFTALIEAKVSKALLDPDV